MYSKAFLSRVRGVARRADSSTISSIWKTFWPWLDLWGVEQDDHEHPGRKIEVEAMFQAVDEAKALILESLRRGRILRVTLVPQLPSPAQFSIPDLYLSPKTGRDMGFDFKNLVFKGALGQWEKFPRNDAT